MPELTLQHWPIAIICVSMLVAAAIDGWKLKVPNWLTFPLIISGWLLGLAYDFGILVPFDSASDSSYRVFGALVGTGVGCLLLVWLYALGGMGGGDVKMQMGFGSWVGACFGYSRGSEIILWAFCTGAIIGGVIALGQIFFFRKFRENLTNTRDILSDIVAGGGIGAIAQKAAERKPRMTLLPYGIPLCIGFLSYLFWTGLS
jgi:prepilin peptidase CpaA